MIYSVHNVNGLNSKQGRYIVTTLISLKRADKFTQMIQCTCIISLSYCQNSDSKDFTTFVLEVVIISHYDHDDISICFCV